MSSPPAPERTPGCLPARGRLLPGLPGTACGAVPVTPPPGIIDRIRQDRTQIAVCALGIAGAVLVAQVGTPVLMLAGFGCWIVSNLALIGIEQRAGHPWLAGMFAVYEVTALIGFWNAAGMVGG